MITWSSYLGMPGEIPDKIVIAINLFITQVCGNVTERLQILMEEYLREKKVSILSTKK